MLLYGFNKLYTIQISAKFKKCRILKKVACDTPFCDGFLIYLKLLQAFPDPIPWKILHGLLYHSAVSICSAFHLFTSAWSFYVKIPKTSVLSDEGSAGLRSWGTHGRLSDRQTVNAGLKACGLTLCLGLFKNFRTS